MQHSSNPYFKKTSLIPEAIDDRWILHHRPPKNTVSAWRPYDFLVEQERTADGLVEDVATVFLSNRECPLRCLMCDLWKNTTDERVPDGAIPTQIRWALERMPETRHIKLYNSGNFFDSQAIPGKDLPAIAELLHPFKSVVVESHPRLIDEHAVVFKNRLAPDLQVAMGLETVHPQILPKLNKRMTLADFETAVQFLTANHIQVRAFILLRPPFMNESDGVLWAKRSLDFAFDAGVECCTIIPTRTGNGALERLREQDLFSPPTIASLEEVVEYGVWLQRGRVFADLWDAHTFSFCDACIEARLKRLEQINLSQTVLPKISCQTCSCSV
ncbi:MAG: radical SAM protein [bacterium]